jgi:hypothetical protein
MRDRGPMIAALTVSTIAVLASCIGAVLPVLYAARPVAFGIGGAGLAAACLGLIAVVQWVRDAEETYPDYRYYNAHTGRRGFLEMAPAAETANEAPPAAPAGLGDKVIPFDRLRAQRKRKSSQAIKP